LTLWAAFAAWVICAAAPAAPRAAAPDTKPPAKLKAYPSRYYVIYTDLEGDAVREAEIRMTAMAEEYHRRTSSFAGVIRSRLALCLFRREADYQAAGGLPGSAGMYNSGRRMLLAVARTGADERLWHVVQHEGFHQFVHMVIGGRMPVWANEGMAEYFGQAIWTGDGFVTAVVPPSRLKRVQGYIRDKKLVDFLEMLLVNGQEWQKAVTAGQAQVYYDQAWSMVHFLVFGEDGRYRGAFEQFIRDISRGADWKAAFQVRLGRNVQAFQKRYEDWWAAQKSDLTEDLYVKAVVQTLTSFLARAVSQGQQFASAEEFFQAARAGELKAHPAQWLPRSLLERSLLRAERLRTWFVQKEGTQVRLVLKQPGGPTFTGTFAHSGGRAVRVNVTVAPEGK